MAFMDISDENGTVSVTIFLMFINQNIKRY